MNWAEIVGRAVVVDLQSHTKADALAELSQAVAAAHPELSAKQILQAVTAREAVATTFIQPGLAIPHARLSWSGGVALAVGRHAEGIEYDTPEDGPVRLLVMLLGSEGDPALYLESLAGLARCFRDREFAGRVLDAPDAETVRELLRGGTPAARRGHWEAWLTRNLVRRAMELAGDVGAQAVLINADVPTDWDDTLLDNARRPVILLTQQSPDLWKQRLPKALTVSLPRAPLARPDQIRLGLLPALAAGHVRPFWPVVCLVGLPELGVLDTLVVHRPGEEISRLVSPPTPGGTDPVSPGVLLRVIELALEIAAEGREGRPVGAMLVIGDSDAVLERGRQLIINPFHGYSEDLRNLMDPSLAETVKEFATLDGAFVIRGDGVIRTAGTYLRPQSHAEGLAGGLGTRHQVAAAVSMETETVAIVVSQSTGTVVVFRRGVAVLTLERSRPGLI
jgi:mannitol/fructose-specific phosphotransferase system IIA component (Ntr-type)